MMNREELTRLAAHYDAKARNSYDRYQETGVRRYYTEYCRYDDIRQAFKIAADTVDEHAELVNLRTQVSMYAHEIMRRQLAQEDDSGAVAMFLKYAEDKGLIRTVDRKNTK